MILGLVAFLSANLISLFAAAALMRLVFKAKKIESFRGEWAALLFILVVLDGLYIVVFRKFQIDISTSAKELIDYFGSSNLTSILGERLGLFGAAFYLTESLIAVTLMNSIFPNEPRAPVELGAIALKNKERIVEILEAAGISDYSISEEGRRERYLIIEAASLDLYLYADGEAHIKIYEGKRTAMNEVLELASFNNNPEKIMEKLSSILREAGVTAAKV